MLICLEFLPSFPLFCLLYLRVISLVAEKEVGGGHIMRVSEMRFPLSFLFFSFFSSFFSSFIFFSVVYVAHPQKFSRHHLRWCCCCPLFKTCAFTLKLFILLFFFSSSFLSPPPFTGSNSCGSNCSSQRTRWTTQEKDLLNPLPSFLLREVFSLLFLLSSNLPRQPLIFFF